MHTSNVEGDLEIRPGLVIPASELQWTAVGASGPGGQHVNKTATKVQLRFDFDQSDQLHPDVKARLRNLAGRRLDAHGRIVIEGQSSRSQVRNREEAREKLAALIERALEPPKRRRPTKPSRGARQRRLEEKRKQAEKKRARKPVRGREE